MTHLPYIGLCLIAASAMTLWLIGWKFERTFDDHPETELALWVVMLIGMGLVILRVSPLQIGE